MDNKREKFVENRIFISAGEVSGDLHISYIVNKMRAIDKDAKFYGVAGHFSKDEGVEIIQDIENLAVMGFAEALKKYKYLKAKAQEYIDFIKKNHINKVILVDYGGFNLKFLKLLKSEAPSVEVYFYIPPKLWVWGENRIKDLKLADHILVIFPWEVPFYKKHGVDAIYFGNPFSEKYERVERKGDKILLLPGSRRGEIERIIPTMLQLVKLDSSKKFLLKLSEEKHLSWINEDLKSYPNLEVTFTKSLKNCVKESQVSVAASGTVTLELALLGIPTVVVYKTSLLNEIIALHILKIKLVSLPNLALGRMVFPELLQKNCNPDRILKEIDKILGEKERVDREIEEIRGALAGKDILKSYAMYILERKEDGK